MTLIVGILAKDGVVIAADRAVTFGSALGPTISDSHEKIQIVAKNPIVAGTGQLGLGQRFTHIVRDCWDQKKFGPEPIPNMTLLAALGLQNFQQTGVQRGKYGALVAYAQGNKPQLIEFALDDFQPELKTSGCWYASMGSGQSIADPYLALVRRSVWTSGQPNIEDATFAAYWVMRQSIAAAPGFIAEPIDIAVLRKWKENGVYESRFLTDDDLAQHAERAERANSQLRGALMGKLIIDENNAVEEMPQP